MVAHETTEESNENREYSRERVANGKLANGEGYLYKKGDKDVIIP